MISRPRQLASARVLRPEVLEEPTERRRRQCWRRRGSRQQPAVVRVSRFAFRDYLMVAHRALFVKTRFVWKYVPIRRLSLMIKQSLRRGSQWVVFEPNVNWRGWAQVPTWRASSGSGPHERTEPRWSRRSPTPPFTDGRPVRPVAGYFRNGSVRFSRIQHRPSESQAGSRYGGARSGWRGCELRSMGSYHQGAQGPSRKGSH